MGYIKPQKRLASRGREVSMCVHIYIIIYIYLCIISEYLDFFCQKNTAGKSVGVSNWKKKGWVMKKISVFDFDILRFHWGKLSCFKRLMAVSPKFAPEILPPKP